MKNNITSVGASCTGCAACEFVCPTNAICIETNNVGYRYPTVDTEKCVECGRCVNACHKSTECKSHSPRRVLAAWAKQGMRCQDSSSGGIANLLYKRVIEDGGVAYGAAWKDDATVYIERQCQLDRIERFAGSKYAESDLRTAFSDIKSDLASGREVLFIGTPCQVAALKSCFTAKNLIAVDLVCHGVPPKGYISEYASCITDGKARSATFRGREDFSLCFYDAEGECVYKKGQHEDPYFAAFLKGLSYRENCYECSYARSTRVGDITLGDFWGIDRTTLKNEYDGRISLVFINSEAGEGLFSRISDAAVSEERSLEEAMRENGQLRNPSARHPERKRFLKRCAKHGFVKALYSTAIAKEIKNRGKLSSKIKIKIKRLFKR